MKKLFFFLSFLLLVVNSYGDNPVLYSRVTDFGQGTVTVVDDGLHNYILTAVPASGYAFYRWREDGLQDTEREICCLADVRWFTAQFATGCTVTFNNAGDIVKVPVFTGCDIPLEPSRSKSGFKFLGWATTENAFTPDITFPYTPSADITLYPVFTRTAITIDSPVATNELDAISAAGAGYADVVINNGGVLTVAETSQAAQYYFKSITVNPGGKLVIPTGTYVGAYKLVLNGGDADIDNAYIFRYPQLVANGTLNVAGNVIYYDYLLNKKQQYPLCLPVDVSIPEITYADGSPAVFGTDFYLVQYNGATRATGVSGWEYVGTSETTVKAGKGYTVFAKPQYYQYGGLGTLVQYPYSRLRFPMHISANYREAQKNITVNAHPASRDNDAGWNLIGNPYFADYSSVGGLEGSNGIGLLTLANGEYNWTGTQRYVVLPADNGRAYASELAVNVDISAFKTFFVQIGSGDAVMLLLANRRQNMPAYYSPEIEQDVMTGIRLSADVQPDVFDKVGILIGDEYTDAYVINADMQKFGHNSGVNLYAWMRGDELAFVAVNAGEVEHRIPVGYIAPFSGQYTFAIDDYYDNSLFEKLLLHDNVLDCTVNLLLSDYSFTTAAGTNNTRFTVSVVQKKGVVTGSQMVDAAAKEPLQKFVHDGVMYIRVNNRLYNAQGQWVQ